MAHKTGQGSTKNGRDSNPKYLGIKVYGGQKIKSGQIIVRQCGSKIAAGNNVGEGKDFTLFSKLDGVVKFERVNRNKKKVSVYSA